MALTAEDLYKDALFAAVKRHLSPEAVEGIDFESGSRLAQGDVDGLKITVELPTDTDALMRLVAEGINARTVTKTAEAPKKSAGKTAPKSGSKSEASTDEPGGDSAPAETKTESAAQSVARAKKSAPAPKIPVDPNDDF